ncbi:MAG: serine/threonine-protein kinase, partial [Pseudomonadota bacterium]
MPCPPQPRNHENPPIKDQSPSPTASLDTFDRWDELNALFEQALAQPADQRADFCARACEGDPEMAALLKDLVQSADVGDTAIRSSVAEVAREIASHPALVGERIGPWLCEDLIGRGGMGEVYAASRADGQFEKRVAVKVVRQLVASDAVSVHARTERQILADLSHPSIPALLDAGQLPDGRPYFVCEFIEGLPIDEYCHKNSLGTDAVLSLIDAAARALRYAHAHMILHLDVKPDNVLVRDDGVPMLLDFGIAQIMGQSDKGPRAFSPRHASPEQIRGERPSA